VSTETTTRPSADEQTPDAAPAVEVRDLVKRYGRSTTPAVDGLSFGYRVMDAAKCGTLRELRRLQLVEVSLVADPMQPGARVHAVELKKEKQT